RMVLDHTPFNLNQVIMDAVRIIEPQIQAPDVQLVDHIDPAAAGIYLGDPVRLRQLLINLLGNAAKFTSRGKVELTVRKDSSDGKDDIFQFVIMDTGIGIAEEKLKAIFEPFVQADMSTTRKYGGTGLGLSISRSIVDIMGSELKVRSRPGEGSEFSFAIRLEREQPQVKAEHAEAATAEGVCRAVSVLVVEDNLANVALMKEFIGVLGCRAEYAYNGKEAVDKLRAGSFDMCFMDIQMPVMGGEEAIAIIRSEISRELPVIALTAAAMAGEKERLLKLGMTDYLSKPVLFESLRDKIVRYRKGGQENAG
ncbi:MAG: response regulator, partial [Candidatus Omnitrophica bacterium]|nr:response regulator [Candidatus Omnitrophota bacterium]